MSEQVVAWSAEELSHELHDCAAFTERGDVGALYDYIAATERPGADTDRHDWQVWARRVHLRWHAGTVTTCALQQQVLAQLPPGRFPQYFPRKDGHGSP